MARGFSIYLACCQLMPVEFWDGFVLFVKLIIDEVLIYELYGVFGQ